jgi:hypothetical protein
MTRTAYVAVAQAGRGTSLVWLHILTMTRATYMAVARAGGFIVGVYEASARAQGCVHGPIQAWCLLLFCITLQWPRFKPLDAFSPHLLVCVCVCMCVCSPLA